MPEGVTKGYGPFVTLPNVKESERFAHGFPKECGRTVEASKQNAERRPVMWTRRQLKEKGKTSFRANYWKAVLIALILTVAMFGAATWNTGASAAGSTGSDEAVNFSSGNSEVVVNGDGVVIHDDDGDVVLGNNGELTIREGADELQNSASDSTGNAQSEDSAHVSLGANGLTVDVEGFDTDGPVHVEVGPDTISQALTPAVLSGLFIVLFQRIITESF
jgi:hypothetical protein